jgi:tRNA (guanosine-2'-O-)-methyltransferase
VVRARNRREIPTEGPDVPISDRFPTTERRARRLESVIARRQPTLTVVLEDVFDPHNASAVLRSCDAVGVMDVHLVYVKQEPPRKSFGRSTSASAAKWLSLHYHDSIEDCYAHLRSQGFRIFATALQNDSHELYGLDLTEPTAFVFGNEKAGVSDGGIAAADGTVYIPMQGVVESLNISVSCAVTLYEAMRQRMAHGMYDESQLAATAVDTLLQDWIER